MKFDLSALRRRLLRIGVFCVAFVVGFLLGSSAPTEAFIDPIDTICFPDDNIPYMFYGSTWTQNEENAVNGGANRWEVHRDADGTALVSNWETTSIFQRQIDVMWLDIDPPAATWCSDGEPAFQIAFDTSYYREGEAAFAVLDELSDHEFGHAHGIPHTGDGESRDNDNPTFMRCHGGLENGDRATGDDVSALYAYHNDESWWLWGTLTPDPSFESGEIGYWGTDGTVTSATASHGIYSLRLDYNGDILYQATRFIDEPRDQDPGPNRTPMDVAVQLKKSNAGATGTVQISFKTRKVDYETLPAGITDCWPLVDDLDLDEIEELGTYYTRKVKTVTPSTTWTGYNTHNWGLTLWWEGVDIKLKVLNDLDYPYQQLLYVDYARARAEVDEP